MSWYIFSIILIVVSNVFYNICQKSTPVGVHPFAALLITYLTATLITFGIVMWQRPEGGLLKSINELNWTSYILGIAIVGLELGYLLAYRAGWNISVGSLVANIALALILIPVGVFLYSEALSLYKIVGIFLCILGLIMINS